MHPARQRLVDELTDQLAAIAPDRFEVHPYEGTLPAVDGDGPVPVVVGMSRINLDRSGPASTRSYTFTLSVPCRLVEPGLADDQLDADVELVLEAIDATTYCDWDTAARGTWADQARPAYAITTTVYR